METKNSDYYEDTTTAAVQHQTYDEVNEPSHPNPNVRRGPRYRTSSQNTYENVKVMNLVGSLKKKLRAGKLKHIDIDERGSGSSNNQDEPIKSSNGRDNNNRALEQGKPVPAARNSMKKDSKNKVNVVKPTRSGVSKKDTEGLKERVSSEPTTGLKDRVSSEPEFVENELYEDRIPFDGYVYSAVQETEVLNVMNFICRK